MNRIESGCVVLIMLLALACHKDNGPCLTCPPPYIQSIVLDTPSAELTTVQFQMHTTDSTHLGVVQLYRDSISLFLKTILSVDTTIVDTALLPSHRYQYKAYRLTDSTRTDSSAPLSVATMDTTSHNFTWQIDTLGDGNSSELNDAAIVNDTLVYAVGGIYAKDSLGHWDPNAYNLAKWSGGDWNLMRIPFLGPCSAVNYPPIRALWVLSSNDILFTNGGSVVHYDGANATMDCGMNSLLAGAINKMFATNSEDIYVVGNNGTIVHYDGHTWQKQESGTTIDLLDIWGTADGSVVWSCGYNSSQAGTCLLRNQGSGWQLAYDGTPTEQMILIDSLSGAFTGVYTNGNMRVYVGSDAGIYQCPTTTRGQGKRLSFSPDWFPGFPHALRGTGVNDLFIVGEYFMVAHYNGANFRYYSELSGNGRWKAVTEKGNLVVAVGYTYDSINSRGIVLRGTR